MNKKTIKVISTVMLIIMMCSIAISSFAFQPDNIGKGDSKISTEKIVSVGKSIVGILRAVGIILSVIVLMIIGLKYMMGSAEEKADYKKSMIPYIVGAALVFAASAFAQVIYDFFTGI